MVKKRKNKSESFGFMFDKGFVGRNKYFEGVENYPRVGNSVRLVYEEADRLSIRDLEELFDSGWRGKLRSY